MANAQRKERPRKGPGLMDKTLDLLEATRRMDLIQIQKCVDADPKSVHDVDDHRNNAMHICVAGGAAIRAKNIVEYFLDKTEIDLLQTNNDGLDPYRLAMALNDEEACELIEPRWNEQLSKKFPPDRKAQLGAVPSGTNSDDFSSEPS